MELFQRDELRTLPPSASASRTYTFAPMRLFGQISVSVFKSMAPQGTEIGAQEYPQFAMPLKLAEIVAKPYEEPYPPGVAKPLKWRPFQTNGRTFAACPSIQI